MIHLSDAVVRELRKLRQAFGHFGGGVIAMWVFDVEPTLGFAGFLFLFWLVLFFVCQALGEAPEDGQ